MNRTRALLARRVLVPSRMNPKSIIKLGGLIAICAMRPAFALASEPTAPPATIRVAAEAKVSVKPDQAQLELGVTTEKKTATAAAAENDRKMAQVLAALRKEIGPEGEIKTSQITVRPHFEDRSDDEMPSHVLGYIATNMVELRVANVRSVAGLLDAAFQAGANTVEQIRFMLKDSEAAQSQALRAASAKARVRATALAEGQGLQVGEVVSVTDEGFESGYWEGGASPLYRRRANISGMQIESGTLDVRATATVIFRVKPR